MVCVMVCDVMVCVMNVMPVALVCNVWLQLHCGDSVVTWAAVRRWAALDVDFLVDVIGA